MSYTIGSRRAFAWSALIIAGRVGRAISSALIYAFGLLCALSSTAVGALMISLCVVTVRLPDALLLQQALEDAARRHQALVSPTFAERDFYLVMLAIGGVFLCVGLRSIETWLKSVFEKEARHV